MLVQFSCTLLFTFTPVKLVNAYTTGGVKSTCTTGENTSALPAFVILNR